MRFRPSLLALLLLPICGCSTWEQTTYKTLAASQAVINQAQTDYEASATAPCAPTASACLPHTQADYAIINQAKADQTLAVNAFVAYEEAKAAGGTTASLAGLQTDVEVALNNLPTIITDVKALYTKGGQ
jgi:hypothetical protein